MESMIRNQSMTKSKLMGSSQIRTYGSGPVQQRTDPRDARQLQQQNNYLKLLIEQIKNNQPKQSVVSQGGLPGQFNKRIDANQRRLSQLKEIIRQQEDVIHSYQQKFEEFQNNLGNLMKLDKDIHAKLNSGQNSATLQKNVRNVLVALNSKAPYDRLIQMIENIKI